MALYQTPKLVKVKAPELVKIKLTLTDRRSKQENNTKLHQESRVGRSTSR